MKKNAALLLSGILLLVQVVQLLGTMGRVQAADISQNLITHVSLTVLNGAGQTVTDTVYEQGASVQLDFDWELPNSSGYGEGDSFTFDLLPANVFAIFNDISGDLPRDDGESVGRFVVDRETRKITLTFNDLIKEFDEVHGKITIKTKFDKSNMAGSTHQVIKFPLQNDEQTVELDFKPDVTTTIDKSGTPDRALNATNINWTVNVNKKLETIQHAMVTDPIPGGLVLNDHSIKVYNLDVKLDGSVSVTDAVYDGQVTVEKTKNGDDFQIRFTADSIHTAYQIQYSTSIESGSSFTNEAVLSGEDYTPASAAATVNVSRGAALTKKTNGYDKATQTVNWQVQYNYGENDVAQADALLTDYFNDSQQLVPGSVKVYEVSFGSGGNPVKGNEYSGFTLGTADPVNGKDGFSLHFNSDIESAYLIEYQTKAVNPVYQNNSVTNTVTWDTYSDSASQGLEQVFGNKYFDGADYLNKTADWHIDINGNNLPMSGVQINDTFPNKGLELIPASLVVKNAAGDVVDPNAYEVTYAGTPSDYTQGFVLEFAEPVNEKHTISYSTMFNYDNLASGNNYPNQAVLTWTDAQGGHNLTATANFDPNPYTKNNGYKSGAYDPRAKEITWTVGVNYNLKELAHAAIVDQLQENQKLVPDSVAVYGMNIAPDGKVTQGAAAAESAYAADYDPVGNKLTVHFNTPINGAYILTFKTSLEGNLIDNKVENTAVLMNDDEQESGSLSAAVSIPHGGEYVSKTGKQNGEVIDWQVDINRNQSTTSGVQVIDKPSANQILLPETFHLYTAVVQANGDIVKDAEVIKDTDYQLAFDTDEQGKTYFTLSFTREISEPYVLQYQSLINANDGETLSNSVKFKGENTETVDKETQKDIIVGVSSGSGSGSGVRGTLTVIKVDKDAANTVLEGAEFKLERKLNGSLVTIGTQTTNVEGKVLFTKLLAGDYVLTELAAPSGYTIDTAAYDLTISPSNLNPVKQISNTKIPGPSTDPTPTPEPSDGSGSSPAPSDGSGSSPAPSDGSGSSPAPSDGSGSSPAPSDGSGSSPAPSDGSGSSPAPSDGSGSSPAPSDGSGSSPAPSDGSGSSPAPSDGTGSSPAPSEGTGSTPAPTTGTGNGGGSLPSPTPSTALIPSAGPSPAPASPAPSEWPTTAPESSNPAASATPAPKPAASAAAANKVVTPEGTPTGGVVAVPEGSTPSIGKQPKHGTVSVSPDGRWAYTPKAGFTGKDTFSILVKRADGEEEEIIVIVDVVPKGGVIDSSGDQGGTGSGTGQALLPQTGESSHLGIQLAGLFFLVLGTSGLIYLRRKKILINNKHG